MHSVIAYAMGPQAALEIGRRQIVLFCSNILDEQGVLPCWQRLRKMSSRIPFLNPKPASNVASSDSRSVSFAEFQIVAVAIESFTLLMQLEDMVTIF